MAKGRGSRVSGEVKVVEAGEKIVVYMKENLNILKLQINKMAI